MKWTDEKILEQAEEYRSLGEFKEDAIRFVRDAQIIRDDTRNDTIQEVYDTLCRFCRDKHHNVTVIKTGRGWVHPDYPVDGVEQYCGAYILRNHFEEDK